ncbi:MAG: hypothetical protein AAF253_08535 [Pseudomonadota bacterium]
MLRAILTAATATAIFAAPAFATGLVAEQSVMKVVEVTNPSGEVETELVNASVVAPGETVQYGLTYINEGVEPVEDMVLTMPVPDSLRYLETTAEAPGTDVSYSVDGGLTYGQRADLTIEVDGADVAATAADITHIRWAFVEPVNTGDDGSVSFQAILR